ncbi:MAG: peptidylprolyl isomerase [Ignavibacteriales bacterium]|nr:peptidylprolyl isomerase [Ignavibacteriales bacterium]
MIRTAIHLVASATFFAFIGCSGSSVVATIGSEKLTLEEFEETYAKNNGGWDASAASSLEDRERFLDLIVKFKLKVLEAKSQGLPQDTAIQNELDSYYLSVAQSYMLEKELVEPQLRELYHRKSEEIRASHILIRVVSNAAPAETLAAYTKAMEILSLHPSVSFDSLAFVYSEDPSAKTNKGDLGFFSLGRMVREFEDACYGLQQGEITKTPIRSQFGYHLIKVTARRPNLGSLRVSHILKRFSQDQHDSTTVRDSARALYDRIRQGLSFDQAAQLYSDDPGSADRAGDLGFYEPGILPPAISEALSTLPLNTVGEPVKVPYGYHIFKVTEHKPIPSYAEMEKDLRQTYQQQRYSSDLENYTRSLRTQYAADLDGAVVQRLSTSFDPSKTPAAEAWSDTLREDFLPRTLYSVRTKTFTVSGFVEKMDASPEFRTQPLSPQNIKNTIERLLDSEVLEEHARDAMKRHPAFAKLMDEYRDGILLYRIEQDEIWKKVTVHDSLLKPYYEKTKEKYRWPERVNFAEIFVTSDSLAKRAHWKLQYGEEFLSVAEEYTMRSGYKEKLGVWGFQPFTLNDLARKASTMAVDSVTEPFKYQNGWSIVKVLGRDSARVKTFEEAGPELMSGFQEEASKARERQWVEALTKKYGVELNKKTLAEAFKRKRLETQ